MLRGIGVCLAIFFFAASLSAGELTILRQTHPWSRFNEGAWKKVRVTVDTFDVKGKFLERNLIETTTTLESKEADGVVLRINSTYSLKDKQIVAQPQLITQTFAGAPAGQAVRVKALADETLTMGQQQLPCHVQQIEYLEGKRRRISVIHYSDKTGPFLLKSQTKSEEAGQPAGETSFSEVVTLDRPIELDKVLTPAVHLRVTQKAETGTTETNSYNIEKVPGGEVLAWSVKTNADGIVTRRTSTALLGYGNERNTVGEDISYRIRRHPRRAR